MQSVVVAVLLILSAAFFIVMLSKALPVAVHTECRIFYCYAECRGDINSILILSFNSELGPIL